MPKGGLYEKRQPRICEQCGGPLPPGATKAQRYCDKACAEASYRDRKALKNAPNAVALIEKQLTPRLALFNPQKAAELRGHIFSVARKAVSMADEVIEGTRVWSPVQARVFATLLDKVVPNLSASHVTHEHSHRDVREMSISDLEDLVAEYREVTPDEHHDAGVGAPERPAIDHHPGGAGADHLLGRLAAPATGEPLARPEGTHQPNHGGDADRPAEGPGDLS